MPRRTSMMYFSLCSAVFAAGCLIMHAGVVDAHGWLMTPRSRNLVARGPLFNASTGNGLGTLRIVGHPGVCGDPYQDETNSNFVGRAFSSQATYASGSVIQLKMALNVNHGGRFQFFLCNRKSNLVQSCFDAYPLKRCAIDNF